MVWTDREHSPGPAAGGTGPGGPPRYRPRSGDAARFSAYLQTPHRFSSKRKLWCYCRLGITDCSNDGKRRGPQRLDKTGHGRLKDLSRKALIAALHTRSDNAFQRAYPQTLDLTHNAIHARLTTQRKILAVLRAMGKGGSDYQDDRG